MSETGCAKFDQVEHLRDDALDQVTGGAGFMYFKDLPIVGDVNHTTGQVTFGGSITLQNIVNG